MQEAEDEGADTIWFRGTSFAPNKRPFRAELRNWQGKSQNSVVGANSRGQIAYWQNSAEIGSGRD
jgi:hypothetical protein